MPRRLLLLVTDLLIGGTPTVVRELALRLHAGGVEVQVACLSKWGPVADQIQQGGVKVTALDAGGVRDVAVISRLARLAKRERIEVLFSSLIHANIAAAMVKMGGGRFELFQSIQTTQPKPRWHWVAQRFASRFAKCVIVPSESTSTVLQARSGLKPDRICVIPNGVGLSRFAGIRPVPAEPGQIRVGFIGRLDPIKNIPDAVDAIARLPEAYCLKVYGSGEDEARIRERIAYRKVESRVTLCGAVSDPREALERMDVLVLPSEAEGFGLVLIEAMAAGVPVVATNAPGIRDVLSNEQDGLLVPVGDSAALAMAIRRMMTDSQLRQAVTTNGRAAVASRYDWDRLVPRYRAVLGV